MRSALETNAFSAGDKRVQHWRRTGSVLEMNAFSAGDKHVPGFFRKISGGQTNVSRIRGEGGGRSLELKYTN